MTSLPGFDYALPRRTTRERVTCALFLQVLVNWVGVEAPSTILRQQNDQDDDEGFRRSRKVARLLAVSVYELASRLCSRSRTF